MILLSTRWLKARQRMLARLGSFGIVVSLALIFTVSASGSSDRATLPECVSSADYTSLLPVSYSLAADADKCTGGVLPKGTGNDLLIDVPCTVNAGTYHYRDVNIIKGGSLQFSDAVINFWAHGILIQNQGSLLAGVVGANPDGSGGTIVPIGSGRRQRYHPSLRQGRGNPWSRHYLQESRRNVRRSVRRARYRHYRYLGSELEDDSRLMRRHRQFAGWRERLLL